MSSKRQQAQRANKKPAQPRSGKQKRQKWTAPTVLGLVLTTVGLVALVELRPQLAVYPQAQIVKSQPFSAPFQIHNAGYLSLHVIRTFCYIPVLVVGGNRFADSMEHLHDADDTRLESEGNETVFCNFSSFPVTQTSEAEAVIVVDYRIWAVPHTFRHYRHFVGKYGDTWDWIEKSHPQSLEQQIDQRIAKHKEFPER